MSRIGKKPITIPAGVEFKQDGNTLTQEFNPNMEIKVEGNEITVSRPNDEKENRALHGLTRSLLANMVEGVTNGFTKKLEVNGVGYRVQKQGKTLNMNLLFTKNRMRKEETHGIS